LAITGRVFGLELSFPDLFLAVGRIRKRGLKISSCKVTNNSTAIKKFAN